MISRIFSLFIIVILLVGISTINVYGEVITKQFTTVNDGTFFAHWDDSWIYDSDFRLTNSTSSFSLEIGSKNLEFHILLLNI